MKFLAFDVETGGIGKDKSLLTAYFSVLDDSLTVLDNLFLEVRPNDGIYHLTAEALTINKIDVVAHDKAAVTEKEAGTRLFNFLKAHVGKTQEGKPDRLVPIGHNVHFDIDFITSKLLNKHSWDQFVGYRCVDTGGLSQVLIIAGLLPMGTKAGLGELAKHYEIPFSAAHTAKGDVDMTIDVLRCMIRSLINKA